MTGAVLADGVAAWLENPGCRVAAATLVAVEGSAPLEPGAMLLVDERGRIEGSVTGGCVDGALVAEARAVLSGEGPRIITYGVSDDGAVDVGLLCGGTVHLVVALVGKLDRTTLLAADEAARAGRPVAVATILDGSAAGARMALGDGWAVGSLGGTEELDHAVTRDALGLLAQGVSEIRRYGMRGEETGSDLRVHCHSLQSAPQMVIFGAIDFSAAVARFARHLGYRVTICDAREPFAASPRFSADAEVVLDWPDRFLGTRRLGPRDAVLVFTHDPKFDEPALMAALDTDVGYIGALGSRRTQDDRLARLREAGVPDHRLKRIAGPCGHDIGARTPEETAVSILAEIVAVRSGRPGGPLGESVAPIHPGLRVAATW